MDCMFANNNAPEGGGAIFVEVRAVYQFNPSERMLYIDLTIHLDDFM